MNSEPVALVTGAGRGIGAAIAIELANPLSGTKKHAAHAKTPAAHTGKAKKGAADADDLLGGGK